MYIKVFIAYFVVLFVYLFLTLVAKLIVVHLLSQVCSMFPGYRCFKLVMFLSGLAFGTGVGYLLCLREQLLDSQLDAETRAGISLGIGLLGGLVSILVRCVGLFLTGLHLGLLLSITALLAAGQYYSVLSPIWVPSGTLLGTGLFFAMLTLCWQRRMTMVATAMLGAAIIIACMDYCIETPMLVWKAYMGLQENQEKVLCWYGWVMLGIWPVVAALGYLVQYKFTAKGMSHTRGKRITVTSLKNMHSL